MYLAILEYQMPLAEVEKHVVDHRNYLDTLYQENKLIFSGPQVPRTGGVILFQVDTREEVDALIAEDPFHLRGVAKYQVMEFQPVKSDARFRELFIEKSL